jgi:DNA repair protein RecO (recombination protein O)
MLHKTTTIVLQNVNYSDAYAIVHVYTEAFSQMAYLTARSKARTTRTPKSLFHPLSVVDLEVKHQNLREIQRIKEAKSHLPLASILNNPVKSAIGIFLAELLGKVIQEVQPNALLFDFILQSVQVLEWTERNYANFHLVFMIRLSRFLGFYPDNGGYLRGMYFDLRNGVFVQYKPSHIHFLNRIHLTRFPEIKSLEILHEMFG